MYLASGFAGPISSSNNVGEMSLQLCLYPIRIVFDWILFLVSYLNLRKTALKCIKVPARLQKACELIRQKCPHQVRMTFGGQGRPLNDLGKGRPGQLQPMGRLNIGWSQPQSHSRARAHKLLKTVHVSPAPNSQPHSLESSFKCATVRIILFNYKDCV